MKNKTIEQKLNENKMVYLVKSEYRYGGHYSIDHQEYGNPSINERFLIVPDINIISGTGWRHREKILGQLQLFGTDLYSYLGLDKEKELFNYMGSGALFSNFRDIEPRFDDDTKRPRGINYAKITYEEYVVNIQSNRTIDSIEIKDVSMPESISKRICADINKCSNNKYSHSMIKSTEIIILPFSVNELKKEGELEKIDFAPTLFENYFRKVEG